MYTTLADRRRRDYSLPGPEGLTHRGCATHTGFDHYSGCSGYRVIVLFVYGGKKRDQRLQLYGNNKSPDDVYNMHNTLL